MFLSFYRVEQSRSRETGGVGLGLGLGLGLSVAHTLIHTHGGDIHLRNGTPIGLCAEVIFPRRPP